MKREKSNKTESNGSEQASDDDPYSMDDEYDDIFNSPSLEESFQQASLIATLAERFQLTSFKPFQKAVIQATMQGKDTLVVHPTGSGKSLCFQFPPVYWNKKAIIITPTISLMRDQVEKLNGVGIQSVFLGSAQLNMQAEERALDADSKDLLIFVTPEWISKSSNQVKVNKLVHADQLCLIAVDEAHLFTEWSDFRSAYGDLRKLKYDYPDVPIMALTATADSMIEEDITKLLRHPVVEKASMNRPNITLNVEELKTCRGNEPIATFAKRAAEIAGSSSSIIYTDFIKDIGPIVSGLHEFAGLEAVGYHGEMDAPSREESYLEWKSGRAQIIVATKAFGMGIDKPDIRHVIRNGVPKNILSWAQELGRAGRDGQQACATILYHSSDIAHANAWIKNNLANKHRCKRILTGFSDAWKYTHAHLAGLCRRRLLLDMFGETNTDPIASNECCDVCKGSTLILKNYKPELIVLIDALEQIGCKGELKIAEWIRGSKISWTDSYNKHSLSYGNHKGKDIAFWRSFIKQCHAKSLIQLELKSMIKGSGHYEVHGMYYPLPNGLQLAKGEDPCMLPQNYADQGSCSSASTPTSRRADGVSVEMKKKRLGKGSHTLTLVRRFLGEPENWLIVENKKSYHFPGVYEKAGCQQLYYVPNIRDLEQHCEDRHFIWKDVQLSKGQLNKDRLITAKISGKTEEVYYRSAPCLGVKYCPHEECTYVVPIRDKRGCPKHQSDLQKSLACPVEFVYIHPKDTTDNRRWFGGIVRCDKEVTDNYHNHKIHAASKIAECVKSRISNAVSANPALTPSEVASGKGIGFLPSAVDDASCHMGKISQQIQKRKSKIGLTNKCWSPLDFEEVADAIDREDNELSGDAKEKLALYIKHGRPYLIAGGIENGVRFLFTMSPLMSKIAASSEFIQCDITYDDCKDYPYIFNAVAFNTQMMEWMVVGRVRMNKQNSGAYALAFEKMVTKCKSTRDDFEVGSTLLGVITDWSDAEINGLKQAIGKPMAEKLLKGCAVHWNRSCQRVADRAASSEDKQREKRIFLRISSSISKLNSSVEIIACFETLCGVRSVEQLIEKIPTMCSAEDARFVDQSCDWSIVKHWAQWWTRCDHLKMLSKAFCTMEDDVWSRCPSTTNAVERKNKDCKSDSPQCLKLAMIKVYKVDKLACLRHLATEVGVSISYRSRSEESRRAAAAKKQEQRRKKFPEDPSSQFGPPDRLANFRDSSGAQGSSSRKRGSLDIPSNPKRKALNVGDQAINFVPNTNPDVMGKRVRMRFQTSPNTEEWFEGVIASYNGMLGKYGVYFPCDGQTIDASLSDEDMEII